MLRFRQPPVQSGHRDSVLLGKCGAREAATPELLDHLQPLSCWQVTLSLGDCLDFHVPSVSKLVRLR